MHVQLADGRRAEVWQNTPVWRTPEEGLGWVMSYSDPEVGHIVDFRSGSNLWQHQIGEERELDVRFVQAISNIWLKWNPSWRAKTPD